eukprot:8224089-Alexandrium_andersonii.AAC.1
MRGRRTGAHAQTPRGARAKVEMETGYSTGNSQRVAASPSPTCLEKTPPVRRQDKAGDERRAVAAKRPEDEPS